MMMIFFGLTRIEAMVDSLLKAFFPVFHAFPVALFCPP